MILLVDKTTYEQGKTLINYGCFVEIVIYFVVVGSLSLLFCQSFNAFCACWKSS
jgi:large-conductance mechanosensitive channel